MSSFFNRQRFFNTFWHSIVYATVFIAIVLSLLRYLTPMLEDYRLEIAKAVETQIGRKVSIGTIEAAWHGFGPSVILNDVDITSKLDTHNLLSLEKVQVGFSLWALFREQMWLPKRIQIDGLHLNLNIHLGKNTELESISKTSSRKLSQEMLGILSQLPETEIRHGDIQLKEAGKTILALDDLSLYFSSKQDLHEVNISVSDATNQSGFISMIVKVNGELSDRQTLNGQAYLAVRHFSLNQKLMTFFLPSNRRIDTGRVNSRVWMDLRDGQVDSIQTDYHINNLQFSGDDTAAITRAGLNLKGHLFWQRENADAWHIIGDKIKFQLGDYDVSENQIRLQYQSKQDKSTYTLQTNQLPLSGLTPLVLALTTKASKASAFLANLRLSGHLNNVILRVIQQEALYYTLNADFDDVSTVAYQDLPGLKHIAGVLEVSPETGALLFNAKDAQLNFLQPTRNIPMNTYRGALTWSKQHGEWQISAQKILVQTPDLKLVGNGGFVLDENSELIANVAAKIDQVALPLFSRYLPRSSFSQGLNHWLDYALLGGQLQSISLRLYGPLAKFPFAAGEGDFHVTADMTNATIRYARQWPKLNKLSAKLRYDGRQLGFEQVSASLMGAQVDSGQVFLKKLNEPVPTELSLNADVSGQLSQAVAFINQSPLEKLAEKLKVIELSGPMQLKLTYHDLLEAHGSSQVSGIVYTDAAKVTVPAQNLHFEALQGEMTFDNHGFYTKKLHGQFLGYSAKFAMDVIHEPHPIETRITMESEVDAKSLAHFLPKKVSTYVSGRTKYRAVFRDIQDEVGSRLELSSDLANLAVTLPEPLSILQNRLVPLSAKLYWPDDKHLLARLSLEKRLSGIFEMQKKSSVWQFIKGQMVLGQKSEAKLPERGLVVLGSYAKLSVDDWLSFIEKTENSQDIMSNQPLEYANVRVGELQLAGQSLKNITVLLQTRPQSMAVTLNSRDTVGKIVLPLKNDKPIVAEFEKCAIQSHADGRAMFPADVPTLRLSCKETQFNKRYVGEMQVILSPKSKDLVVIESVAFKHPNFTIDISGDWQMRNEMLQETKIKGRVSFVDVEKLLNAWHLRSDIDDSNGNLSFNLHWPSSPTQLNLKKLHGDIKVFMENGRIIKVDSDVGKFISFLSLHNLQRRLTLDFRDVFDKGFTFDYLKGDFVIDNGVAFTSNLELDGSQAYIRLSGHTDLVNETLNLQMKMSPHVTGTLPVAAAVATGNPAIGAVVWVVDKIFSPQINEITQYDYHIHGPWQSPKIE